MDKNFFQNSQNNSSQNSQNISSSQKLLNQFYSDDDNDNILMSVDLEKYQNDTNINLPSTSRGIVSSNTSFKVDISSSLKNKISVGTDLKHEDLKTKLTKKALRIKNNPWLELVEMSGLPLTNWPTLIRSKIFLSECGNKDKCFLMSFYNS